MAILELSLQEYLARFNKVEPAAIIEGTDEDIIKYNDESIIYHSSQGALHINNNTISTIQWID